MTAKNKKTKANDVDVNVNEEKKIPTSNALPSFPRTERIQTAEGWKRSMLKKKNTLAK